MTNKNGTTTSEMNAKQGQENVTTGLSIGDGVRLFDHLGTDPIELEEMSVVEPLDVMHLGYRVITEK